MTLSHSRTSAASGAERSGAAPAERSVAARSAAEWSGAVRRGMERSGASGARSRVSSYAPMRHFGTLSAHRAMVEKDEGKQDQSNIVMKNCFFVRPFHGGIDLFETAQ